MKRILLILNIVIICITSLTAQHFEGKVVAQDGQPLISAYIYINNGSVHAHTNELGFFSCEKSQPGDTINISYLGFEQKRIVLDEQHFEKATTFVLQEKQFDLGQVVVSNSVRSMHQISKVDLQTNPVNSSQEILRKVPGLFIGQHAGGGKAEQLFLRGFDIDHGTDVSISVDGLPVNMVSHAHGQGYADLHFLIPETVERLDFGKGPYYAEHGNFTTAGYVDFQTKDKLENSQFGLEYGRFNTARMVGLFDLLGNVDDHNAYLATEYLLSDGPVESPQDFSRFNLMGKYSMNLPNDGKLAIIASHFTSKWDASGQIPQRAVESGMITRFGSIDDTEGGKTSRTNFMLHHTKSISNDAFVTTRAFYSKYDFELFSNFTFWLNDPENGDQIRQVEDRQIFGLESVLHHQTAIDNIGIEMQAGVGMRYDLINDNELSHTLNRKTTLEQMAYGDVNESNLYGYANAEFNFGKILINPGLRLDYFKFDYENNLSPTYSRLTENKAVLSPKLNVIYNPNHHWQLFAKSGIGFHSNDSRVVVLQDGNEVLPLALGVDLGAIWKPAARVWFTGALWALYMEQEFVYVGDEGVVEPSGKSRRLGLDVGMRYQLNNFFYLDADINYAYARSTEEPEGADYIPLAPDLTAIGGLSFQHPCGIAGGVRYRYLKNRPANENNSLTAEGYFLTDVNVEYSFGKITVGAVIENLFNNEWNEAQFATESRLQQELDPVEEIHFTPGTPFFLKGKVVYRF